MDNLTESSPAVVHSPLVATVVDWLAARAVSRPKAAADWLVAGSKVDWPEESSLIPNVTKSAVLGNHEAPCQSEGRYKCSPYPRFEQELEQGAELP